MKEQIRNLLQNLINSKQEWVSLVTQVSLEVHERVHAINTRMTVNWNLMDVWTSEQQLKVFTLLLYLALMAIFDHKNTFISSINITSPRNEICLEHQMMSQDLEKENPSWLQQLILPSLGTIYHVQHHILTLKNLTINSEESQEDTAFTVPVVFKLLIFNVICQLMSEAASLKNSLCTRHLTKRLPSIRQSLLHSLASKEWLIQSNYIQTLIIPSVI